MENCLGSIRTAVHLFAYRVSGTVLPPECYPIARKVYYGLSSLLYAGNNVFCPCCNKPFRRFLSFKGASNVLCPGCGASYWHRAIWLYLKNKTSIFCDHLRVLHIAPEYVFWENLAQLSNLDYVSVDLSSPLAEARMDITKMACKDNCFDVILCSHVLEHILDERGALQELFRVLKPMGWAILQVPINRELETTLEDPDVTLPKDRERIFGQFDHVRMYGRDYRTRLEKVGFVVKEESVVEGLDANMVEKYGLWCDESIYLCTKARCSG